MDPLTIALITAAINAGGSALAGSFGRQKPTQRQNQQGSLIDNIMQGLQGEGEFANLFNADEADFQKQFVDPAQSRFRNQTAPQIQQSFIQSGQQRGTGLEDSLARAGIDMDSLLNQQFGEFQQGAQNRQVSGINAILNSGAGVDEQSFGDAAKQGFGGFLTGEGFGKNLSGIFDALSNRGSGGSKQLGSPNTTSGASGGGRRGFA